MPTCCLSTRAEMWILHLWQGMPCRLWWSGPWDRPICRSRWLPIEAHSRRHSGLLGGSVGLIDHLRLRVWGLGDHRNDEACFEAEEQVFSWQENLPGGTPVLLVVPIQLPRSGTAHAQTWQEEPHSSSPLAWVVTKLNNSIFLNNWYKQINWCNYDL